MWFLENGPNRAKQVKTGQNRAKRAQTGTDGVKQCKIRPNRAKQWKIGPNRANLDQMRPTGADQSHLEPIGPCNGFHMSLYMMDEKLKLDKEKIKQIHGTRLKFKIHGIGFRVRHIDWHLCSNWYGQMLPGQMSPWQLWSVLDIPRNLPVKFHRNRVSSSWDVPDMDKCHMNKRCMDECHCDTLNLFKMIQGTYL